MSDIAYENIGCPVKFELQMSKEYFFSISMSQVLHSVLSIAWDILILKNCSSFIWNLKWMRCSVFCVTTQDWNTQWKRLSSIAVIRLFLGMRKKIPHVKRFVVWSGQYYGRWIEKKLGSPWRNSTELSLPQWRCACNNVWL